MLRSSLGLPPLYTCHACSHEVDLESAQTLRMVRGWTRSNRKTIVHVVEEEPTYIHEYCLHHTANNTTQTLF
jgi:hypothetical protein